MSAFDLIPIQSYLGLDADSQPNPKSAPIDFLTLHMRHLPPHLLVSFSNVTTPKERTRISTIRNRRLKYANGGPSELQFPAARSTWPLLYDGQLRRGQQEGEDERDWAAKDFLQGLTKHVGKLGNLLGGYEAEREAERFRTLRRNRVDVEFVPEEESDSDDDEDQGDTGRSERLTDEEDKATFERLIRERFIYGLLEDIDYDKVDWDESLDVDDDRETEERWFDEDEE
ncbi:hypothetical protein B0H15DRAFT_938214 [Mycena belliarum]|uniref:CCD97-like C-terminal domain-containing protein n=1 Tax=Mycena belliarum TaxID=1033014 RepID=A0AAD6UBJ9_9AGAR|nr:hypothetical protein B0H15DRAFT_938214 [Mycena belliae]